MITRRFLGLTPLPVLAAVCLLCAIAQGEGANPAPGQNSISKQNAIQKRQGQRVTTDQRKAVAARAAATRQQKPRAGNKAANQPSPTATNAT